MQYDYVIIGAGMGGLSAANFLAKYGKRVLVLEKHHVPGGLVTSFPRHGVHFDLGIHGLFELGAGQAIPQFLAFWGAPPVETVPLQGDLLCFVDDRAHRIEHGRVRESFLEQFPHNRDEVNRLCDLMEAINREMFSGGEAPEPPYDMNLFELIRFGMRAKRQRPLFMKYGNKDVDKVLDALTGSDELKALVYSKSPYPMVFMAFAYQWGVYGRSYYPLNGMQAIPDAAVAGLERLGGELKLNTEVTEILARDGRACGVRTADGAAYYGAVISNASPQFTYGWLPDALPAKARLQRAIAQKPVFEPVAALFMAVDEAKYALDHLEGISVVSGQDYRTPTAAYTPETAPIVINIYPRRKGDALRSLVALVPLSYEYRDDWQTGPGGHRGEAYRHLKAEVEGVLLDRIAGHLGPEFRAAISHHELSTPLTYERYTYSQHGSFMGWSVRQSEYGKYLRQRTAVADLFLVGQWVFPGFGVAGVMASGYYLAREILKGEGIDVKQDFTRYFAGPT